MSSLSEKRLKVMKKGIDVISSDSDDVKPKLLLAEKVRSGSAASFRKRAEKVWVTSSTIREEEEKVGDIVSFGQSNYFIVDIFEKEIMELGDKVDLNFKRFKKFESVDGDAPRDHHYYNNRCCYSSCCCVSGHSNVEKEWSKLETELALRESKGVTFFVRTYEERRELMRIAASSGHELFFFDIRFPTEYPHQAPSFFYHPYGLPLSNLESQKHVRPKLCYNVLDVFLHIEEIVLKNTNKCYQQMIDMLKHPLSGFEDFVRGRLRTKAGLILRDMMEELDMEKESDKNMFWKMYIAFEENKAYCEHILNKDLKEELQRIKEKECSLSDYYYSTLLRLTTSLP